VLSSCRLQLNRAWRTLCVNRRSEEAASERVAA
jgi:hypothetical protein